MPTFTGYEPKNLLGKGPDNSVGGQGTTAAPTSSSSAAPQQLVAGDTVGADLSNIMEVELSSLLEDLYNGHFDELAPS